MAPYDRTIPYNDLPELPPMEDKVITIKTLHALNSANKALAELKGFAKKLPNQSMLINTIALREAKASTAIENIFTTEDELYKALSGNDLNLKGNAKEVLRYREALWSGYRQIKETNRMNQALFVSLYQEIKQINEGIRPTQSQTVIKKRGSGLLDGSIAYTPPRGEAVIEKKLDNLLAYINDDQTFAHDPLIKLAISHYQFEAIHPFRDGNGRAGRILCQLLLIQKQLLDVPILYLSAYIIENKDNYYAYLNQVTAQDIWENWILYILKAVEETALFTIQKIQEIDDLFNRTTLLINQKLPGIRKETIEKLFEQPYVSPKALLSQHVKSVNTAKKYLMQMEELRIVVPEKIGKEVVYLNVDLLNLLADM